MIAIFILIYLLVLGISCIPISATLYASKLVKHRMLRMLLTFAIACTLTTAAAWLTIACRSPWPFGIFAMIVILVAGLLILLRVLRWILWVTRK